MYWEGRNYLSLTTDWNYSKEYVKISMPDYVRKFMDRLQHPKLKRLQYAPHRWSVPAYGKILQMAPDPDKSGILDKNPTKRIQSILGTMLCYACSVGPTTLWAINKILRVKSRPTRDTEEKASILQDCAATYLNAIVCYKASDMVLHVDSDTSHLTMPEARSCYAGYFYLSDWHSPRPIKPNHERNGPIHMECKTIRNLVSSASEALKYGTLNNRKKILTCNQNISYWNTSKQQHP